MPHLSIFGNHIAISRSQRQQELGRGGQIVEFHHQNHRIFPSPGFHSQSHYRSCLVPCHSLVWWDFCWNENCLVWLSNGKHWRVSLGLEESKGVVGNCFHGIFRRIVYQMRRLRSDCWEDTLHHRSGTLAKLQFYPTVFQSPTRIWERPVLHSRFLSAMTTSLDCGKKCIFSLSFYSTNHRRSSRWGVPWICRFLLPDQRSNCCGRRCIQRSRTGNNGGHVRSMRVRKDTLSKQRTTKHIM